MTCPVVLTVGKETMLGEMTQGLPCKKLADHKGAHEPTIPKGVIVRGQGTWRIRL